MRSALAALALVAACGGGDADVECTTWHGAYTTHTSCDYKDPPPKEPKPFVITSDTYKTIGAHRYVKEDPINPPPRSQ